MADSGEQFSKFYQQKQSPHLYPTEFVIRAFLGKYPNLTLDKSKYPGRKVLDLGYGDGRNMPLLHNMGLQIHGVELSDELNHLTAERLKVMQINTDLRLGSNKNIPFDAGFFDYILACHSCYYVEENSSFSDNLAEIARVSKSGSTLVCSLPMHDGYLLKDATPCGYGHFRITRDPYGLRDGVVFRTFADEQEIIAELSPYYGDIIIGFCDDNYWGIRQKMWTVIGTRR